MSSGKVNKQGGGVEGQGELGGKGLLSLETVECIDVDEGASQGISCKGEDGRIQSAENSSDEELSTRSTVLLDGIEVSASDVPGKGERIGVKSEAGASLETSAFISSISSIGGGLPTSKSYSSLGILIFNFFARGLLRYHQL